MHFAFVCTWVIATLSLSRSRKNTLVKPSLEHLSYLYITIHHLRAFFVFGFQCYFLRTNACRAARQLAHRLVSSIWNLHSLNDRIHGDIQDDANAPTKVRIPLGWWRQEEKGMEQGCQQREGILQVGAAALVLGGSVLR